MHSSRLVNLHIFIVVVITESVSSTTDEPKNSLFLCVYIYYNTSNTIFKFIINTAAAAVLKEFIPRRERERERERDAAAFARWKLNRLDVRMSVNKN